MTDNTEQELKELIDLLTRLAKYNIALQEQTASSNEQFIELTKLLEQYQEREHLITQETVRLITQSIQIAFENQSESYHKMIERGFIKHFEQSARHLTEVQTELVEQAIEAQTNITDKTRVLNTTVERSTDKLETHVKKFYNLEQEYLGHFGEFDKTAKKVSDEVINSYQSHLKRISDDFGSKLASRLMWIVISFSAVAICVCLFVAWFIIPSKDELSTRKAQYDELAKGQLLDNIIKTKDNKYYAEIDPKTCYEIDKKYWGKKTVCQFTD